MMVPRWNRGRPNLIKLMVKISDDHIDPSSKNKAYRKHMTMTMRQHIRAKQDSEPLNNRSEQVVIASRMMMNGMSLSLNSKSMVRPLNHFYGIPANVGLFV